MLIHAGTIHVLSPTSETHSYFIVPGGLLLALALFGLDLPRKLPA